MKNKSLVLILDNIRSRENVGSIFRTADAAGVDKVYLCGITPTPPHEKISKTALGAENSTNWSYEKQAWRLIERLKIEGYKIIGLEQVGESQNIFDFNTRAKKIALIVGNEVKGINKLLLDRCDNILEIPMAGVKESLNVSVAAGIAIFQIKRPHNRGFKK